MDPSLSKSLDLAPPPPPPQPVIPFPPPLAAAAAAANQIPNHAAPAANPAPGLPQNLNHPSYDEMIYAAITALKEKDGSSKRAIAKYIEKVYTDLPPTHSALLTHHLKRLKNNGSLIMVKKSYKLPRSDVAASDNNAAVTVTDASVPHAVGPKKGRGRPPKSKPTDTFHSGPGPIGVSQPISIVPGPVVPQPMNGLPVPVGQPTSVKRGRGRPPKNGPVLGKRGRGRPPKSGPLGPKKSPGPGRPRKPKSISSPSGLKRGRGRPSKDQVQAQATSPALAPFPVTAQAQMNLVGVPVTVSGAQNLPKVRGRPKKTAAAAAAAVGGVIAVASGKRRGRPPKAGGVISPPKPKSTSGRPVGRPKKNAQATTEVTERQWVAYADLKRKLEFFQSKVRQAVGVLKPQFTSESDISAIAAIQELEGLAAMDTNTPLRDEPPPQPALVQNQPPLQPPPFVQSQPHLLPGLLQNQAQNVQAL